MIPSSLRPNASSLTSAWDFDNRLSSATTGTTTVSHQYDALGRRVARTSGSSTTVYVQAGQQTIADYASGAAPGSSTYRYVYASYIDEPVMRWTTSSSTAVYYHRNQQYSVTALTDSSGSVLERYAYTAYGVPTICNPSGVKPQTSNFAIRHTYTGREWDNDIQQYHYRARMYDPALGRFCSRDPIGYLGGLSQVSYVRNNPIFYCDPIGFTPWSSMDFVLHYWFGLGSTVDLADVGLWSTYWNHPSVVSATNGFISNVEKQIRDGWSHASCEEQYYYIQRHENDAHTNVTDTIFVVGDSGGGGLKFTANCGVTLGKCKSNCGTDNCRDFKVECFFSFLLEDWFQDPLDIYECTGFPLCEVGIPYKITSNKKSEMTASGDTCEGLTLGTKASTK